MPVLVRLGCCGTTTGWVASTKTRFPQFWRPVSGGRFLVHGQPSPRCVLPWRALWGLLHGALILSMSLHPHDLTTCQRPRLQTPSPWVNFGGVGRDKYSVYSNPLLGIGILISNLDK